MLRVLSPCLLGDARSCKVDRVLFMRMRLHSLTYLNIWSFVGGIRRCGLVEGGVSTRGEL